MIVPRVAARGLLAALLAAFTLLPVGAPAAGADSPSPFTPYWVQSIRTTSLWSNPSPTAIHFGDAERWRFFQVTGAADNGRLLIRDPRSNGTAWVDAGDVLKVDPPKDPRQAVPPDSALARLVETPAPAMEFDIPAGKFFRESLGNRADGTGYAVQDGQGADLWTEYVARGGPGQLGYPISRRFEVDGRPAQAFEKALLVWNPDASDADVQPLDAKARAALPGDALQPDLPPILDAELVKRPWSGWYWPTADGFGPTLFAPNGPLAKYDRHVAQTTGQDPGTQAWERQEIYFPGLSWAGHCNGYAAAALLEDEPTEPRQVADITFSVGDLKGLLSDYHFADAAAWSYGQDGTVNPADFQRMLVRWFAGTGRGFIATFLVSGNQLWNFPVYRVESTWSPDPDVPYRWRVKTTLWLSDLQTPPDFVGVQPWPDENGKTFEYTLDGDPRDPSNGAWVGDSIGSNFAHPAIVWYPDSQSRNLDPGPTLTPVLTSPNLDRAVIDEILGEHSQGSNPGS